jgi:hypothetical protein
MTPELPIFRSVLLAAPLAVAGAALLGADQAPAAAASAAVVLVNLGLLALLGPRLVASVAADDGQTIFWGAALCAKFVLLLAIYAALLRVLEPVGLAIGLTPLLLGTLLAAIVSARRATVAG